MARICVIEDCPHPVDAHDWCSIHLGRWRRHGDPLVRKRIMNDDWARFLDSFVLDPDTGCHLWTKATNKAGYSRFRVDGVLVCGHIWVWERKHGPVPEGKELDHYRCDTPRCVNDEHVRPASGWENTLRSEAQSSKNKAKEKCSDGHAFTPENTRLTPKGERVCRKCERRRQQEYRNRKRLAKVNA